MSGANLEDNVQQSGDHSWPITNDDHADKLIPVEEAQASESNGTEDTREDDQSTLVAEPQTSTLETAKTIQHDKTKTNVETVDKKKTDEKLGIYKTLAIKLKKELVKTRDELQKLKEEYKSVVGELRVKLEDLELTLKTERVLYENTNMTLEATCKNLKSQLETSENDLRLLQTDFDTYKLRATKIMQQNNQSLASSDRSFDEDRYKQLKALSEQQKHQITELNSQIDAMSGRIRELEHQIQVFKDKSHAATIQNDEILIKCEHLTKENTNLKQSLKQISERQHGIKNLPTDQHVSIDKSYKSHKLAHIHPAEAEESHQPQMRSLTDSERLPNDDEAGTQISPSASVKDDTQTNSSSSFNSSTYGYVHIKPTAFEIINRTSVLEDAHNQIDNLTKAYLDSESTNSLLTEQVCALKEEIRRIQRRNERMELANNLEYLKNVMFKFLTLDNSQVEQKQRLVPVLSTVLKLSPEETQKLNNLTAEKGGMASSFFKL